MSHQGVQLVAAAALCCTMSTAYGHVHMEGFTLGAGQPKYKQVKSDLIERIAKGDLRVGEPIPSTPALQKEYGVSFTVVRRAVQELKTDGLLKGEAGRAVFVRNRPPTGTLQDSATRVSAGLDSLQAKLDDMRAASQDAMDSMAEELANLRRQIAELKERLPREK
ncbi:winged helix-turn-helix domain-containing protein [Streptomyces klenkii]|uniref:winged helix-turn-helix domain-containing protein n=1 Tax=Streptomyces klenkii TaxID=1420899 RepID=UPI00342E9F3A